MTDEAAARLKRLMRLRGAIVIFGEGHVEATTALIDARSNQKAVFSGRAIGDLPIPDGLMIECSLLFCHSLPWCRGRGPSRDELARWNEELLKGISFVPPRGAGIADADLEDPAKSFTADEKTNELNFLVQWGPVPSTFVVETARSLERAYARLAAA